MTILVVGLFGVLGYVLHPVLLPASDAGADGVVVQAVQRDFEVRMEDGSLLEFNLDELSPKEYPKHLASTRTVTLSHPTKKELIKVRAEAKLNILKVEGDLATVTLRDERFTGQVPLGQTDFFERIARARMKKNHPSVAAIKVDSPRVDEVPVEAKVIVTADAMSAREVIVEGLQNGEYPALNEALISDVTELSSEKDGSKTIRKVKVSYLTSLFFGAETKDLIVTLSDDKVIKWAHAK